MDNEELKTVVKVYTSQTTRELVTNFDVTIPTIWYWTIWNDSAK